MRRSKALETPLGCGIRFYDIRRLRAVLSVDVADVNGGNDAGDAALNLGKVVPCIRCLIGFGIAIAQLATTETKGNLDEIVD